MGLYNFSSLSSLSIIPGIHKQQPISKWSKASTIAKKQRAVDKEMPVESAS
jgi:hypothetical protein